MHAAEEDAADDDPEDAGQPTENGSLDGAGDGAGAGDRGEVVSHQDRGFGRNIVHAVFHGVSRRRITFADTPLLAEVTAVENVAAEKQCDRNDEQY